MTAILLLSLIPLSSANASPSTSTPEFDPGGEGSVVAEFDRIERGEDVVIIYPKSNIPANGAEQDYFPIGPIDDDTFIIVADENGSLPGGLDQDYIDSLAASNALSLENLQNEEAFLENDDHNMDASSTSIQPASTCSTATGVPGAGWGGVQSPTYVMSGDPARRMGYTHQIAPGTNQSGIVRGLGHARDSNGNYGRIWSNFGATGSNPRTDSVVWGAVAAYPHLQAQTTSIHLAQVRWCH